MEGYVWLAGVAAFAFVCSAAFGVRSLLTVGPTARQRVARVTQRNEGGSTTNIFTPETTHETRFQLSQIAAPSSGEERNLLRDKLIQGGFRSPTNLEQYLTIRAAAALTPPLVAVFLVGSLPLPTMLVILLGAAALGYYLPALMLDWRVRKRQSALLRPFPDALDLLVCCVEAGLGLDAAFRRVAEEIEPAAPELSQELQMVNYEVSAGMPRAESLKRLDARTGINEMASLVSVLVQADRFGTSIAKALRIHAELVRKKRMLVAEENAAQISPKLTVVMILFILPTLMAVLIGPAIINIGKNLWPTLSGGG